MELSNVKAKLMAHRMRIMVFDEPFAYNYKLPERKRTRKNTSPDLVDPKVSAQKSRTCLWDIIQSNSGQHVNLETGKPYQPQFTTFTFAELVTDPSEANRLFRAAVKRINRHLRFNLCYVAVPEYQKDVDLSGNPGGRLHFHVLFFNLPFTKEIYSTFLKLWSYGGIYNKSLTRIRNVAAYVTKYMQKDFQGKHVKFKKRFFCSRGVLRPKSMRSVQEIAPLAKYLEENLNCTVKTSECQTSFMGRRFRYIDIEAPFGTSIASLVEQVPMDTEYLLKKLWGGTDEVEP